MLSSVPLENGYLEWAQSDLGVVVHTPLSLRRTVGDERGVFCEENIAAESIVVSIPFEGLMSIAEIDRYGAEWPFVPVSGSLREDDALALLLLAEKYLHGMLRACMVRKVPRSATGTSSRWHRHIQLLPTTYHSVLNSSEYELASLQGTNLYTIASAWRAQIKRDFAELAAMPLKGGGTVGSFSFFTLEEYTWALCSIFSRFITIQRQGQAFKAMAPVFDMFNHSPFSNTAHGFQDTNDCLHIVTFQEWSTGDEVCINYGPLSNERLMLLYGFSYANNPHDCVCVYATMEPSAPNYAIKKQVLQSYDVKYESEPFRVTKFAVPTALIQALRVQRASEDEVNRLHAAMRGLPISPKNEQEVWEVLERSLEVMLEGMEKYSTYQQDKQRLIGWSLLSEGTNTVLSAPVNERNKQLVLFRFTQTDILTSALRRIREYFPNVMNRIQICDDVSAAVPEQSRVGLLLLRAPAVQRGLVGECVSLVERRGLRICLLKQVEKEPIVLSSSNQIHMQVPACVLAAVGPLARLYCARIADTMNERFSNMPAVTAVYDSDIVLEVLEDFFDSLVVWDSHSESWLQDV